MSPRPIHPKVALGHVHLKVANLERALDFYRGVLGFELTQRLGDSAAFISAGGYHHHIGLNTWESPGGSPPPAGAIAFMDIVPLLSDCFPARLCARAVIASQERRRTSARFGSVK
jgi:catechol 2,3-dioxygenase